MRLKSTLFVQENALKMSSVKWWPFCPGGDGLIRQSVCIYLHPTLIVLIDLID